MFAGESDHTLDAKHRLAVPRRVLDAVAPDERAEMALARGTQGCLFLYTRSLYRLVEQGITPSLLGTGDEGRLERAFYSSVHWASVDKTGRLTIPGRLLEHAGIDREVTVVGLPNRIELWSTDAWRAYITPALEDYDELARRMRAVRPDAE